MPIKKTIKVAPAFIDKIKEISPSRKYTHNSPLFYEGQIPIVAYLVIDGSVILSKKKKTKNIIHSGHLIGLNELMNHSPSKLNAEVSAESTLCFLDKSTMQELLKMENSDLPGMLLKMTESKIHSEST